MRWLLVVLLAGCYHPHIADESLQCGPGGLCPGGFTCNAEQLCQKNGDSGDGGSGISVYTGQLGATDLSAESGTLECSTLTGAITLVRADMSQKVVVAAHAAGFVRLAQTSGPLLGVWSFASFTVPATITIKPTSDSDAMPVFAASGAIAIGGAVTWRGYGGFHGLAGAGGQGRNTGVLFSGGAGGVNGGGGGGAGYGNAGSAGLGTGGGEGGLAYGTSDLAILEAGSGGGGGGSSGSPSGDGGVAGSGGVGGNGGGSVAILSSTSISLSGAIDVSGQDGTSGDMDCGGGGGGSGGSILISAPTIAFHAGHSLTALGGNGASGTGAGGEGGGGAVGRIDIAGTLTVDDMLTAQPTVATAMMPATSFPAGATISR